MPFPFAVVDLAQSCVQMDGDGGAAERQVDGFHRAAQVGGEHRYDPVVAATSA
jgi:hypothetical protein